MRAAVLVEPGRIEMQERPIPTPGVGDVLIRVSSVGVCGSDTHYYRHGRVGSFVVEATTVLDPRVDDVVGREVDAFIDASGAPAAVVDGIRAVRPAGTVVLVGSGAESMELPTQLIQNRELVLTGVFRYANTWPTAIALVESGRVDLDTMVTARFPLEKAAEALDSDRTPGSVKTVVAVS